MLFFAYNYIIVHNYHILYTLYKLINKYILWPKAHKKLSKPTKEWLKIEKMLLCFES